MPVGFFTTPPEPELMLTCPFCKTPNFTERGLIAHRCKYLSGNTIPNKAYNKALFAAKKASEQSSPTMPKKPTKPTASTEPDQTPASTTLAIKNGPALTVITEPGTALKAWVKKPDPKAFAKAWAEVDSRLVGWLVTAVKLGLVAEAIKAALPHGQFQPWVVKSLCKIVVAKNLDDAARTIRRYMQLARAWEKNQALLEDAGEDTPAPKITNEALVKLKGPKLDEGIRTFIGDRTLRQMLEDLREAGVKANQEEAEEEAKKSLEGAKDDAEKEGKTFTPMTPEEKAAQQLEINWLETSQTMLGCLEIVKLQVDVLPVARLEEARRMAAEQLTLIDSRLEALKAEEAKKRLKDRADQHRHPKA